MPFTNSVTCNLTSDFFRFGELTIPVDYNVVEEEFKGKTVYFMGGYLLTEKCFTDESPVFAEKNGRILSPLSDFRAMEKQLPFEKIVQKI